MIVFIPTDIGIRRFKLIGNYFQQSRRYMFLPVCLSVHLLARLLKNVCMDLDEMSCVDRRRHIDEPINF